MHRERPHSFLYRAVVAVVAVLVLAFYFVQQSRMGSNHTDGGLILTYVDDIANGKWPHYDFIDAYGPLNWPGVVLFYKLAGHKVWGIRIWMVILKIAIVIVSFKLVQRLSNTFYATLSAIWMTLLYGMAWQSLQTAYGFNNVIPFVFGAWYFLLSGPLSRQWMNLCVAGVLTAVAIWIKVNAGLFVLAGGLFHCFYWLPVGSDSPGPRAPEALQKWFRLAQVAGLAVYVIVFYAYVHRYFDAWYFTYLVGPVLIGVGATAWHMWRRRHEDEPVFFRLRTWGVYLGATLLVSVIVLFAFVGVRGAPGYIADQASILRYLDYRLPFSLLGVPDEFIGFNECYWLQVPWLFTLVFLAWLVIQSHGRGELAFGDRFTLERARGFGLYMLTTLYQHSMYSRADETHVFQAMVVIPPALFILLWHIEAFIAKNAAVKNSWFRWTVAISAVLWGTTIVVIPGFAVFDLTTGERKHPKLQYLWFREIDNPYVRPFTPDLSDNGWDRSVDAASAYIDSITEDGEPILVFDANRLVHVLSNTRPVGDRYHFYFYLISTKLFKRPGFDKAVPPHVLQDILDHPPRVAVGTIERIPPVGIAFPELRHMVAEKYTMTRKFRHIVIFELKPEYWNGHAPPSPRPPGRG